MRRTDPLLLADILDAIEEVLETAPSKMETFHANKLVRSHVLRHIQIIGEAVSRLSADVKHQNPQIPWRPIAGMRHAIVHDYFEVDWDEVYRTAIQDIPPLEEQIRHILNRFKDNPVDGSEDEEGTPALPRHARREETATAEDTGETEDAPLPERTDQLESDMIRAALETFRWNKTKAAEHLGLKRTTLQYKIKKYGLE